MYTSVINSKRAFGVYLAASAFCAAAGAIYEAFSHGVYTPFMYALFLWPLLLGAVPFAILWAARRDAGRLAANLYNSGVATLTVGSAFLGAMIIYGADSRCAPVFFIVGAAFMLAGVISALVKFRRV